MATTSGSEPSPFKYVYYREETTTGPSHFKPRLKPSVWGGVETVLDIVQESVLVRHYFGLSADLTFMHFTTYSSGDPDIVYGGVYQITGDRVAFVISDGDRLVGHLRALGREMIVEGKVYSLLE